MAGKGKLVSRQKEKQKPLIGKPTLYVGMGTTTTCPICGRSQKKGMVRVLGDKMYCSERCASKA